MAILGTWEDGSAAWHEARATRIGGSEIGTIMGWSPFESRQQLLERKAGLAEPKPMSAAMKRGHWLEPAVLAYVEDRWGVTYDQEASRSIYVHDAHPWALASPDAITTDGILIEAKSTADRSEEKGWGRALTDQIPLTYICQVLWYLEIVGLESAIVAVIHGATNGRPDLSFSSYKVHHDAELAQQLLAAGAAFMNELESLRDKEIA